jgi:hypothetical protein
LEDHDEITAFFRVNDARGASMPFLKAENSANFVAAAEGCVRLRSSRNSDPFGFFRHTASACFTTAAQPNAGFASCYGLCCAN